MGTVASLDVGALTCQLERRPLGDVCSIGNPEDLGFANAGRKPETQPNHPAQAHTARQKNSNGSSCGDFDAGALSCQLQSVSMESEVSNCTQGDAQYRSSGSLFTLHDFLCTTGEDQGCRRSSDLCFLGNSRFFIPCYLCQNAPAALVEVPCGHVALCQWCDSGTVATGSLIRGKCVQCDRPSSARIDISRYLESASGEPKVCFVCHTTSVEVLSLPCGCLCHCANCFPDQTTGCPSCGHAVIERVVIAWPAPDLAPKAKSTAKLLDAPHHEELLQWPPAPSAT
eukprot:gnl/MRDRNA2_/MRDRNA2_24338_c0_seq1.p1 gnl/MRDRNA2_/MRDRNA2_24338_c0~~gnl/MRDRNA2_/MRDRNA2_24338_c0_seq1.p1  ORF type:complete len:284 (-),score=26.33 gnl/MRDRNA2_/MRDRNA2_24338_c0_seq1:1-852(-)